MKSCPSLHVIFVTWHIFNSKSILSIVSNYPLNCFWVEVMGGFGLAAHYQSVMPVGQCPILKHYMWTKTTEKSIRLSSSSSIFSSTKIDSNHKKRKNCEDSSTLSKKRKNSQGCHICTLSFSNGVKKNAIVENIATKPVLANALMFKVFSLWHEHFVICFMYATLDISNISLLSWTFHNMFYVCNNKYI